ncbi:MAG: PA0069 family radical SAM protein [Burkholderiaceae bacterium]
MASHSIPIHAIKGRGTATRMAHRFSQDAREGFDDGWDGLDTQAQEQGEALPPHTQVRFEDAKSIITANDSPDIFFDYSINPYRGCEHGCVYCFARPTHSYLGLSPGLDFETQIIAKRNIAQVLRQELAKPSYVPKLLNIGSATDCYQPVERELRLTRSVIALLGEVKHPYSLLTKSSAVELDIDLIAAHAQHKRAAAYVSITTLDGQLARILEPRAAAPHRRLRTIRALAQAGIPVGVSVAPQIPFINEDMEQVLEAAREAGAQTAFYTVLRLPWEINALFQQWLQLHYPQRAERVMARVRDMRGGKDYNSAWGQRMKGDGLWADLLRQRFQKTCARLGLNRVRHELDLSQFAPPALDGQERLF